jgi:hypothetical protein
LAIGKIKILFDIPLLLSAKDSEQLGQAGREILLFASLFVYSLL